ncbi:MAG TPA: COX15/CtaA family protein [Rhodospirillales bacterium]|nr:COX15/CtaA family protein [Rhodospirillales bacterium]
MSRRDKAIAIWLLAVVGMVFVMVVLGGVTRLTHSGLSMVEWKPLTGWLPPLDETEWQAVFGKYRQFPEYAEFNPGMTLAGFKAIFWLQYAHRLWGRLIGAAFLLPGLYFFFRGWLGRRLAMKLLLIFVLGAAQGGLGWYMVKSGLVSHPDVSPYRLTAHFGLALAIIGVMSWVALGLSRPEPEIQQPGHLWGAGIALAGLIAITALSGGFVAGLDAGFVYNTFPLMDGWLIPDGLFSLHPFWRNFFEDITTVQFVHRSLAEGVLLAVGAFWIGALRKRLASRTRLAVNIMGLAAAIQIGLGISTLLLQVPPPLAAGHQAWAVVLFVASLWVVHQLRPSSGAAI